MTVGALTTVTSFSWCNPIWFLFMVLRQWSGLCSFSSRKYPGTEGTNQNRHWNHHRWHAERTRLSCWCLQNHKWCTYRAPVRYVTKTWSVVLLNKKKIHILLSQEYCVWQVVKTLTIILNNHVYYRLKHNIRTSTQSWNISYIKATCFGCKTAIVRPMQNIYKVQYKSVLWDPISFTIKVKIIKHPIVQWKENQFKIKINLLIK